MRNQQLDEVQFKVFKKRWLVLALLVWLIFLYLFTLIGFGYLNNVMVAYFETSYAAIDWLVLGCNIGTACASPIIACFALKNQLSCKKAMITASCLFIIGFMIIIIGFLRPSLYFLVVVGQVLNGFAGAIVLALPGSLAQLWFDETQIGLATGLAMFGSSAAGVAACILPPQLIKYNETDLPILQISKNISHLNITD